MTILFLITGRSLAEEIVVIVNKDNPETSLSKSDLLKMYTGKKSSWSNGASVKACNQKLDGEAAGAFLKSYLGKSTGDYQALWMEIMLSGSASPPKAVTDDGEVIAFVKSHQGGIGYIAAASLTEDVKKIDVEK